MYSRVLTCGTFDLFHIGHVNMLKKAKEHGDYLIVGVSSDKCNAEKNKKSIINEKERLEIVRVCKYVDEAFIEESLDEKANYVKKYEADVFVIGDDWKGHFDTLSCDVIYLPRTRNISTTIIKQENFPDLWPITLYEKCVHVPLDKFFMNMFTTYFEYIYITPNAFTMLSLSMCVPIIYVNNHVFRGICFMVHDMLDRCDGSLARVYNNKNILRNCELGAYLDAICDKLFVLIIGIFLINNRLFNVKAVLHMTSICVRTYNYMFLTENTRNKSTISGKMATFTENLALSAYYLMPDLYGFFMVFSLILAIQSLYEKVK